MENLSRNDTIYFCIDDPSPPYKGVRGKGNVKVFHEVNFKVLISKNGVEHPIANELIDAIKVNQLF
jgi:hypothetical protein